MTHIESVAMTAPATFGRDGAMFESLLGFVAQLSWVLWGLVILTAVIRFVGIRIYRRGAARTAPVATVAPSAAVRAAAVRTTAGVVDLVQPAAGQLTDAGLVRLGPFGSTAAEKDAVLVQAELNVLTTDAVTNATFEELRQPAGAPAAVAASVKVPRRALRSRRAEPRSAAHRSAAHLSAAHLSAEPRSAHLSAHASNSVEA